MFGKFTWSFSSSVIIDGGLLVLALCLTVRREFRSLGFWLLAYAISALYGDYNLGVEIRDKALGSSVAAAITLPPMLDFIVDLCGRIALLVAIWVFFVLLRRSPTSSGHQSS